MKPKQITTHEAKTHLSKYLNLVMEGQEILISRGKDPVARLVGVDSATSPGRNKKRPPFGTITATGVTYSEDCFTPLEDAELENWGL